MCHHNLKFGEVDVKFLVLSGVLNDLRSQKFDNQLEMFGSTKLVLTFDNSIEVLFAAVVGLSAYIK